jgi:hypothetical protein
VHYEVERRTNAGNWVSLRRRYKLLADARLEAEVVWNRGSETRIVQVADDGTRTMLG